MYFMFTGEHMTSYVPLCLTGREVCLAVWAVKMNSRFLYPCGLLLDLRGNYTKLIKKKMWQMKSIKVIVAHVTMLWP